MADLMVAREMGDMSIGDERRFVVSKVVEETIIPRGLKEERDRLVLRIAEIDDILAKVDKELEGVPDIQPDIG